MNFKDRLKYIERLGQTFGDILTTSNPVKAHCGRECMMCSVKTGDCTKQSIVYQISCMECQVRGNPHYYYGETARTGWERARKHQNMVADHPDKSALGDHVRHMHEGEKVEFTMKLVTKTYKPLERQCVEAQEIRENKKGVLNKGMMTNVDDRILMTTGSADGDDKHLMTDSVSRLPYVGAESGMKNLSESIVDNPEVHQL